jgi:hypothetical protein
VPLLLDPKFLLFGGVAVLLVVGVLVHRRHFGLLRRGMPVWSSPVPPGVTETLRPFQGQGVQERSWGWFKCSDGVALICATEHPDPEHKALHRNTAFPYVATLPLDGDTAVLRAPLSSGAYWILAVLWPAAEGANMQETLVLWALTIPLASAAWVFNHRVQHAAVRHAFEALAEQPPG